eukprot:g49542.t1
MADKINAELLAMTYGAMVTQLLKDHKDVKTVNAELEKMGYNIGVRLIDEFLAKANINSCSNFRETSQVIAKVGFKMFLGLTADVTKWRQDGKQCSIVFKGNPLNEFVELPPKYAKLRYSNVLCGVLRGALHTVNLLVEAEYIQDVLCGDPENEIRLTLKEVLQESYHDDEV